MSPWEAVVGIVCLVIAGAASYLTDRAKKM